MTEFAIVASGVRKSYGDHEAVAGIDLQMPVGKCYGLLGPNGAGKTTFLRMCLGIVAPSAGQISVLGYKLPEQVLQVRKIAGVVPQDSWLDPDFNCTDNLLVYANYFGIKATQAKLLIPKLLEFAGISDRQQEPVNNLSSGLKRRLALARSLINDPQLIFLDEPTTALDPQARHLIWDRLRQLRQQGKSLLLTTHFMEEAERLCDKVLVLNNGKIIAIGSPAELIDKHVEREVIEISSNEFNDWLDQQGTIAGRIVKLGTVTYCYADDCSALVEHLGKQEYLVYTRRPAGLEDVYLRLTGHGLRE